MSNTPRQTTLYLTPQLIKQLKIEAIDKNLSMTKLVQTILNDYYNAN